MIKNIVFDLGNVLVEYSPQKYLEVFVDNDTDRDLLGKEVFSEEWYRTDTGELTLDQAIDLINQRVPQRLHLSVEKIVKDWVKISEPIAEMEELLLEIKAKGYSTYLLSNTNLEYHNFKKLVPATSHLLGEYISAENNLVKPSREIYLHFLETFGLKAEESFFIDDIEANISGAKSVGMHGHVFDGDIVALKTALEDVGVLVG